MAGALTDRGVDNFMLEVGEMLQPGSSVLFLLVRKMTDDKVLDELKGTGGKVLRTSFDRSEGQQLREALEGELAEQNAPQPA